MTMFYDLMVFLHAAAGLFGLAIFWLPALGRKGTARHRRIGNWFVVAMTATASSALLLVAMLYLSPLATQDALELSEERQRQVIAQAYVLAHLLLVLGLLLLANTRHAVLALRSRRQPGLMRQPVHRALLLALGIASAHLLWRGFHDGLVLYYVFAVLGLMNAIGMWLGGRATDPSAQQLLRQHIGNIVGAGIAAHTAFLVFGGRTLMEDWLPPELRIWLWFLPSMIGVPVIFYMQWKTRSGPRLAPA